MVWSPPEMRRRILWLLAVASGSLALGFVGYHLATGRLERAAASLSAVAAAGLILTALYRFPSDRPAFGVASVYAMGATLYLLASSSFPPGDFIWCLLVPPLIAYSGGAKLARWVLPAYLAVATYLVLRPGFAHGEALREIELPVRFLGLLALLSVVAWIYEYSRGKALMKLSDEVEERCAAERSLDLANGRLVESAAEAARLVRRAEAASEAKSRFLSQLNHDIRTPLTGIVGMASLLEQSPLDPRQRRYVDTIRISGETLSELFDQLLDLARLESGRVEPAAEPFQPRVLMREVLAIIAPLAEERGLSLAGSADPDLPEVLVSDPRQVRRVLLNLASNAVRFTDQGEVAVRLGSSPEGEGWWRITVRDTGIGIPLDQHQRIFESFTQVQTDPSSRRGGTGLGLSICARLVAALEGRIGLEGEEGHGSTFFVDLPPRPAPGVPQGPPAP